MEESLKTSKQGCMEFLSNQISEEFQQAVYADRKHAFGSAECVLQRKSFDPHKHIFVIFADSFGRRREGINNGGLTLEFFKIALIDLCKNSSLFEGPEEERFLALDLDALAEEKYLQAGKLIAVSIAHGGPGPHCFSPDFVTCILECNLNMRRMSPDAIFDEDLKKTVESLVAIITLEELRDFVLTNSVAALAGVNPTGKSRSNTFYFDCFGDTAIPKREKTV